MWKRKELTIFLLNRYWVQNIEKFLHVSEKDYLSLRILRTLDAHTSDALDIKGKKLSG